MANPFCHYKLYWVYRKTTLIWYNIVEIKIPQRRVVFIYRQEILQDIRLFTSQPAAKFYDSLFLNLDLSFVPEFPKTGRKGFSKFFLHRYNIICK